MNPTYVADKVCLFELIELGGIKRTNGKNSDKGLINGEIICLVAGASSDKEQLERYVSRVQGMHYC